MNVYHAELKFKIDLFKLFISLNIDMTVENIMNLYIDFIQNMIDNGIDINDIVNQNEFRNFRSNNLITIRDAQMIDIMYFGHCGGYWLSAYNYPIEGEYIDNRGLAEDVGLLTFNICN